MGSPDANTAKLGPIEPASAQRMSAAGPEATTREVSPGHHREEIDIERRIEDRVRQRLFTRQPAMVRIGRFLVLEEIGRGGMGTVYTAYDERLDRKVAIKVLLDDELPGEEERIRFRREAQAQARLSHPNVVTVHEVGEHGSKLFLAMELVRGQSLRDWLRTAPDGPQILEVFVQAGRGLVAAHRAGLVHRDLKPANIMRGDDGVVKVLDFGLARVAGEQLDETAEDAPDSGSSSALSLHLTHTGMIMGTPAYMSPEQLRGDAVDARSDQYSFCVAVWEALAGERPFAAATHVAGLLDARLEGPPSWPDSAPSIPRHLVQALRRGLSPDPSDRWPSMEALLPALRWTPRPRRPRWLLGLCAGGALGLGGAAAQAWAQARIQQCSGAAAQLSGAWDPARRLEVKEAIVGIGRSYASDVWTQTDRELSAYASSWVTMHTETCEATTVRGEQSTQVMDLRMGCLRQAAMELEATVDTLIEADAEVVRNAHTLTSGLRPLERCADMERLYALVEPPGPQESERVERARTLLARAKSLRVAGRYGEAQTVVAATKELLVEVEYGPVRTEVALAEGIVLETLGEYEASRVELARALELGSTWRQWELVAEAARHLMFVVGVGLQRAEAGLQYWPIAAGLSHGDAVGQASARAHRASLWYTQGRYADAEEEYRAVLVEQEEALGPDHLDVASTRSNLASVLNDQGRYEDADAEYRASLAATRRALGPDHPEVAVSRSNLANNLHSQGRYEEAEAEHRTALASKLEALDPDHLSVASSRYNLANVLFSQGRHEEAEAEYRTALASQLEALGPDHPLVAKSRNNLGNVLTAQGRYDEAEVEQRAALASKIESLGADHPIVARARNSLAGTLYAQRRYDEAEIECREVLASREKTLEADHPEVASARSNLASVLHSQGKYAEAEAEYRAALASTEQSLGADHPGSLETRGNLANTLAAQGKLEEAEAEHRAVLASREEAEGADHPGVAFSRHNLAGLLLDQGRTAEALPLAEGAWDRRQRDDVPAEQRAETAFVLAKILWVVQGTRRDRTRARRLADIALRSYRAADGAHEDAVHEVKQWLAGSRGR